MTPFFLMIGAFALLHLPALRRWPGGPRPADKAAGAMGLVMFLPGVMHLTRPEPFVQMIPPGLPWPEGLVLASGGAEILLAAGLLVPATRRLAGWFGVLLFLAIWPANIHTAISGDYPAAFSQSAWHHWIRVPFQLLYIGWAAWAALGHVPGLDLRRRVMARFYDQVQARHETWISSHRERLLSDAAGTVVELGPGTGANLPHYPAGVRWIGIEPNRHMHKALVERAGRLGIDAECRVVGAEGMEQDAESVDVVVSTLVLCSVEDPVDVLADVVRVLRPGGRFLFIEHVAAPPGTGLRRVQRLMRPLWRFWADGCCPDRETERFVRAAGFAAVETEAYEMPREIGPRFVSPHVTGSATKS